MPPRPMVHFESRDTNAWVSKNPTLANQLPSLEYPQPIPVPLPAVLSEGQVRPMDRPVTERKPFGWLSSRNAPRMVTRVQAAAKAFPFAAQNLRSPGV